MSELERSLLAMLWLLFGIGILYIGNKIDKEDRDDQA